MPDDELDEIRRKYAERIQNDNEQRAQQEALAQQKAQQAEQEAIKQNILRQILTENARIRLANVKLVKPEFAAMVENQLVQLAQSGRITQINEQQLIALLKQITARKRDTSIQFRRS